MSDGRDLSVVNARLGALIDTANVILLTLDMEGRITFVNRFACALLGWTAEELHGCDFIATCVPARSREAARQRLCIAPGVDESVVQDTVVTRAGDERLIDWRTASMRDDGGRITGTLSSGTDVTERTAADAQLRLQSAALNASATAMVIFGRTGLTEWVNPAFSRLTGYTAAEAVGKNPRDLVKSGHHDRAFYKDLWETILAGQVWHGEMINRRKDGTLYAEEQTITPVLNSFGEVSHFIDVKQDITERKRAEAEFRERTQLTALSAAVGLALTHGETLGDALRQCAQALVTHLDAALARIWTANEREGMLELQASAGLYTHVTGPHGRVPVGHLEIGRIARDRTPHVTNAVSDDPEVSDPAWARREGLVAFAGYPLTVEGQVVGVMAIFARHPLADSVVSALDSVAHHVALGIERHRSADALRTTEERMRFALENAGVGVWDLDYATGALSGSDIFESQLGLPPGTHIGTIDRLLESIHPLDRDAVRGSIVAAARTGLDFSANYRIVRPDSMVRWLNGAGRVHFDESGEPRRVVGISTDVTERRTLEEQFQQAQKMEAVGRLAGGVAHDFNNVLTAILGYCELLLADSDRLAADAADIAEIQKAGAQAAGLTRQLLAFSRKQIIEPTLLDLSAIVADMRGLLARLIGADVKVVVGQTLDLALVKADRGQIEQVVMNLVVNARDAMPKGGTLTIETANVELDEHYATSHLNVKPGAYVVLTVTDTGTGMTPEVQARLFEPFFTTKEPGKGTGLGMAIVYGVVARSGGTIGIYSEVGRGTSFRVYFPTADTIETRTEPPADTAPPRSEGQTVLVVEDADGLRELAKRLLERQGYTVLTAEGAAEALRVFEETPTIDVLLTDVVMPGASGPELTEQLVAKRPALKVIYMSGYTEDSIIHHGFLEPGISFLQKPFTSDTLGRKIREVLEQ